VSAGSSETQVLELLTEYLRTLMIVSACGEESNLLEVSSEVRSVAARQSAHFDAQGLVHLIALCDSVARSAQGSATARAIFDATIVRLCLSEHMADIATLLRGERAEAATPRVPVAASAMKAAGGKKKEPLVAPPSLPDHHGTGERLKEARTLPRRAPAVAEPKPSPMSAEALWQKVRSLAEGSQSDRARIDHLRVESLEDGVLRLAIDEEGARMARFLSGQAERLAELVKRATGQRVRVVIDAAAAAPADGPSRLPERTLDEVRGLGGVARAMELFDGTIVSVEEEGATGGV
jgi:hypothetical protein